MFTMLDSILGKSPSVPEILATLDSIYLPPGAPRTKSLPAAAAKSAAPVELGKKPVRPTVINPPRTARPGQLPRPATPNPPRRAPTKRQIGAALAQLRKVAALLDISPATSKATSDTQRVPAPAVIERPRGDAYLTKMERLTQPARDVEGITKNAQDSRVQKGVGAESTTLLDRFAPRSFA